MKIYIKKIYEFSILHFEKCKKYIGLKKGNEKTGKEIVLIQLN
jgi:hypothetical protein